MSLRSTSRSMTSWPSKPEIALRENEAFGTDLTGLSSLLLSIQYFVG